LLKFNEEPALRLTADSELVAPILALAETEDSLDKARVPAPEDEPLIVPLTEEALFKVKVDPVFRTTLPVIALEAAKAKAPEDPPPTVTVEALIDSLAVIVVELAILRAASPLVEPKLFPEAIVLDLQYQY
jgi:hypothetical protein